MAVAQAIDWDATGSMLGGVSSSITAVVAVIAAAFAWNQINENRRLNAEDAYLNFHKMGFDNPQFAEPNLNSILKDEAETVRYHLFVISMLICIERIITILPGDREWRISVLDDLNTHREYLCSDGVSPSIQNFSKKTQALLNGFVRGEQTGAAHAHS